MTRFCTGCLFTGFGRHCLSPIGAGLQETNTYHMSHYETNKHTAGFNSSNFSILYINMLILNLILADDAQVN